MAQPVPIPRLPPNPTGEDFSFYRRQLESYFEIAEIKEDKKVQLLLYTLGKDGQTIYDGLPDPKQTYKESTDRFEDYYSGRSSVLLRRKEFYETRQATQESITEFACRLRRMAQRCDFGGSMETMLRDILVIGVKDNALGEKLLGEDATKLTFDTAVRQAEAFERARSERRNVSSAAQCQAVIAQAPPGGRYHSSASRPPQASSKPLTTQRGTPYCYRCGTQEHNASYPRCPATTAICHQCGKKGHYARVCRSAPSTGTNGSTSGPPSKQASQPVRVITKQQSQESEQQESTIFAAGTPSSDWTLPVSVGGHTLPALVDTGAEVNVIPAALLDPNWSVSPTTTTLLAIGNHPIHVIGETILPISVHNTRVHTAKFIVANIAHSHIIISPRLGTCLGLLPEGLKREINSIESANQVDKILEDHTSLFVGVGTLHGFQYQIEIDDSVRPVACGPRRLPPAVVPKVEAEIDDLLHTGIIRKVEHHTQWVSPLVIVTKTDGRIRLCVDLRQLNKAIRRPLYQIPTVNEVLASANGAKIFSKLDLNKAFHQIQVHPDSQELLTFGAPSGRYCFQRLPYGISAAPEVFQMVLDSVLKDIPGCRGYFDDILVSAENESEHLKTLKRVLTALQEAGITLNKEKCVLAQNAVEFLGHILTAEGVSPSPEKVKAIATMPVPDSTEKLRSFLGLANWVGQRFIHNFASIVAPLWDLLKKDAKFVWDETHMNAFRRLQEAIAATTSLSWFDPSIRSEIHCDASSYGIGACLLQKEKPVAYVSRTLTETEKRYSVIEKEFLAIVFALRKLRTLIVFTDCEVHTDHKPIVAMVNKPIDSMPMRIQRWMMAIQDSQVKFKYVPGPSNVLADALSRNPQPGSDISEDEIAETTLCFLATNTPISIREVADSTEHDPVLQDVIAACLQNWPSKSRSLQPFYAFRDEISVKESNGRYVLFRGNRLLVPNDLIQKLLEQLHEGHIGVQKMKDVVRSCLYWPGLTETVTTFVRNCEACAVLEKTNCKPPIEPIAATTSSPYQHVAVDLTGPSERTQGHTLLTIIDVYSRYPEAYVLKSGSSAEIEACLRSSFSHFGIPERIQSDNGSVFISREITAFFERLGIQHIRSANYHPNSNGCVERFHGTLKNRLDKILQHPGVPFAKALDRALFDIRSTPNAMTGCTPASRFLGRELRTTLQLLDLQPKPTTSPRDAASEYSQRHSTRCPPFQVGDKILFRKGRKGVFLNEGTVRKQISEYAYVISESTSGRDRVYNRVDMKRRPNNFTPDLESLDAAHDAFERASQGPAEGMEARREEPPAHDQHHRYYLRPNRPPMQIYRS